MNSLVALVLFKRLIEDLDIAHIALDYVYLASVLVLLRCIGRQ